MRPAGVVPELFPQGSCQPCSQCLTDDMAVGDDGSCFPKCPVGPIIGLFGPSVGAAVASAAGELPALSVLANASVDLAFTLLSQRGESDTYAASVTTVLREELVAFLQAEASLFGDLAIFNNLSYASYALDNIYRAAAAADGRDSRNQSLPLIAAAAAIAGKSQAVVCPRADVRKPLSADLQRLSAPGCPCSYAPNASVDLCPAGYICSRKAFRGLGTDGPSSVQLRAVCVPCLSGQYCPQGITMTTVQNDRSLDCPAGYYCPTPSELHLCPAGAFCGASYMTWAQIMAADEVCLIPAMADII
ncbi:hypothetical protein GPECTOR_24g186 [Gonium pectorale]|uniref:Uncharacterized protein n=1 Tax=Gonium pectorale TaxID=33097 RepID=A0A150GGC9_GONPE|nr:hypothetical protein GPECTOR_24g186 [Gonium pectorale]|eukprot:KXZ48897.1 hypothetical protein GPECTOR_24g186 [Gonium pectorale]